MVSTCSVLISVETIQKKLRAVRNLLAMAEEYQIAKHLNKQKSMTPISTPPAFLYHREQIGIAENAVSSELAELFMEMKEKINMNDDHEYAMELLRNAMLALRKERIERNIIDQINKIKKYNGTLNEVITYFLTDKLM